METTPVRHGGRYKLQYRGNECLNCGHPLELSDRYCPNCSQANSTKHLSMKDFVGEFFNDFVNFDTRLVRTLQTMLRRPGQISLDFIAGRRMTYANPFRLLLSVAIIYFVLLNLFTLDQNFERWDREAKGTSGNIDLIPDWEVDLDPGGETPAQIIAGLDSTQLKALDSVGLKGIENLSELDSLDRSVLDSLGLGGLDSLGIKGTIKERKRKKDSTILADPKTYLEGIKEKGWINRGLKKADFFLTLIDKDSLYTYEETVEKYALPYRTEDKYAYGVADSIDHLNRQPGTFLSQFLSAVPFAIFAFLPLFTVFLWLIYIRKNYNYTDNLVFSFHSQSLFFILLIVSFLIDQIFGSTTIGWFILIFAIYLYLSMKRFYGQGWFKTTIKYFLLNTVFVILASVAALIFLVGSALTY